MQDLSQQDIKDIIGFFRKIKTLQIEGNTILYRNPTQIEYLGIMAIGFGILCFTAVKGPFLILAVLAGIAFVVSGIAFIMKFRSYAILNLTLKTIYTEYRLGDMV